MIAYHEHSIVGAWSYTEKWRYRPRTRSDLNPLAWWQAPCTVENLRAFIGDPLASMEEKMKAIPEVGEA